VQARGASRRGSEVVAAPAGLENPVGLGRRAAVDRERHGGDVSRAVWSSAILSGALEGIDRALRTGNRQGLASVE
jgi:hypothetical protein